PALSTAVLAVARPRIGRASRLGWQTCWAFQPAVVNAVAMGPRTPSSGYFARGLPWRGAAALAGVVAALAVAPSASAQTSLHVSGEASLGYTDNMLGTASNPAPGAAGPVSVWFTTLTPGLELYSDSERARYYLAYGHP